MRSKSSFFGTKQNLTTAMKTPKWIRNRKLHGNIPNGRLNSSHKTIFDLVFVNDEKLCSSTVHMTFIAINMMEKPNTFSIVACYFISNDSVQQQILRKQTQRNGFFWVKYVCLCAWTVNIDQIRLCECFRCIFAVAVVISFLD